MRRIETRRSFFSKSALAGAALQPLAAFGQAVQNTNRASSPSDLRITDVKCAYVEDSLFVKIHTNQGIWGCGEAVDAVDGTYHLVQNMGRQLRNKSPLNVNALAEATIDFMIRDPTGADKHRTDAFEALWRIVA